MNVLQSQTLPDTDFYAPDQVLDSLNRTFPAEKHNDMFFTIWYGVYNQIERSLTYASGGHPPALILSDFTPERPDMNQLLTRNFVVGGMPDVNYQKKIYELKTPSRLYLYSDGVCEISRPDGSMWKFDDFLAFMSQPSEKSRSNMDRLLNHAQQMSGKERFEDDFTILEVIFE